MPPRGVKGAKNKRMYEKIKKSAKSGGRSTKTAKRIAAATVNKKRASAKRSRAAKKGGGKKGGGKRGGGKKK
jgi:hypothetical protein